MLQTGCVFNNSWKTEPINDCSKNCGRGFIKRKVLCMKRSIDKLELVEDDRCSGTKPSNIEACQGQCSPTLWKFSDWTNASICADSKTILITFK